MVRNQRDNCTEVFAATDFVEDYDFSCNTATEVGDALATLIRALYQQGIISGSVAA